MINIKSIFFHVDVNSAFLSWTAVDMLRKNPNSIDIRTIPSVIAGDPQKRHGIIVAKSIPAKKYNIQTGDTLESALKKCNNLKVYTSNIEIYKEQSVEMGKILSKYSPHIQQYSIDEYFLEYIPLFGSPEKVAKDIQNEIFNTLGFTVNVGISDVKVLAKMASDFEKPNKIHTLYLNEIQEKLWPLPIENLFLCGKSASTKLRNIGINTIGKLANSNINLITNILKSHGKLLYEYANGIDSSKIEQVGKNKCYSNCVTSPKDITTLQDGYKILFAISEHISKRIRADKVKVHTVTLQVKLNTFKSFSHSKTFSVPVDSTEEIYNISKTIFDECFNDIPIRLLGINLSNIESLENSQLDFFSNELSVQNKIDKSLDMLKSKFGNEFKICRGGNLNNK